MKTKSKRSFTEKLGSRCFLKGRQSNAYVFDDVDDAAWAWGKMFTDLLDEHAPVKADQV